MSDSSPRDSGAYIIAPLAAPAAVFICVVLKGVLAGGHASGAPPTVPAMLVTAYALFLFGAPPAYAATLLVLWPAAALLRRMNLARWWSMTAVAAVAGGVLMPIYQRVLVPRGTLDVFPGVGWVAGGAVGFTLWRMIRRQ